MDVLDRGMQFLALEQRHFVIAVVERFAELKLFDDHSFAVQFEIDLRSEIIGAIFVVDAFNSIVPRIDQSGFFLYLAAIGRLVLLLRDFS